MILDIPLVRQPEGSVECGIAGITMLLNYYNNINFEEVKKDIQIHQIGTYAPQLGTYLIKKGFDVKIITFHPGLFTKKDLLLNNTEILDRFKQLYDKASKKDKTTIKYFIEFLENGGEVKVKIPGKEDVLEEINEKRPVCALLTSNFLTGKEPKFNFHFNIITGIDDTYIYVNDPAWGETGGKHKHPINEFFYGIYASAYGDLDNACLITAKLR